MNKKVDIIKDADSKSIVVINDLRFKGRRSVDWNIVEDCLKEYIGECAEITETSDVVYIGSDFPDEFAHSKDTKELRNCSEITCTICLSFSSGAPVKNPQCTPVHLRFLIGTPEEKSCATCTGYF